MKIILIFGILFSWRFMELGSNYWFIHDSGEVEQLWILEDEIEII